MADTSNERSMGERAFWVRVGLTMGLVAVPMAWTIVLYDAPALSVGLAGIAAAVAILAIWDTSRFLPNGLIFWGKPKHLRDEQTGLYNPDGWERLLAAEEDRCRRHGLTASVVVVRVKDPDDGSARRTSEIGGAIRQICRAHDVAAYLDEGTFGILAVASGDEGSTALIRRIQNELGPSIVRWAAVARNDSRGLLEAWRLADARVRKAEGTSVSG